MPDELCDLPSTDLWDRPLACEEPVNHPGAHHEGLTYWDRSDSDELHLEIRLLRAEVNRLQNEVAPMLLAAWRRVETLVGREYCTPESVIDAVAFLVEQRAALRAETEKRR